MPPLSSAIYSHKSNIVLAHLPTRRRKAGIAYAEGERTAEQALRGSWTCEALFIDHEFTLSDSGGRLMELAHQRKCRVVRATKRALAKLTGCETAPPAGVIVCPPTKVITELDQPPSRILVLDKLKDPGNAGTLVRTAAAFRFCTTLTEGSVSLANEKLIRSSAGICFLPGAVAPAGENLAEWLSSRDFRVFVFSPRAEKNVGDISAGECKHVALVLGSEVAGVDEAAWPGAEKVRIPIAHAVESLNVAVSGAIALYEFSRELGL